MLKNFMIPTLTFLVGAGVGFLVAKKVLEQKYAIIAEEEIASVREAMERARLRKEAKEEAEKKEAVIAQNKKQLGKKVEEEGYKAPEVPKNDPSGILTRSSLDTDPCETAKRDYHKIGEKKKKPVAPKKNDVRPETDIGEEDDPDEVVDDAGKTEQDMLNLTQVDRVTPYVIDDVQYSEEFDHHDKVSLYYYRVDGVLCEENEELIDDIEACIGYEALTVLDTQTNVWVRNEPLGIDYEIIALNSSYAEAISGLHVKQIENNKLMTPRERYVERQKRRENNAE